MWASEGKPGFLWVFVGQPPSRANERGDPSGRDGNPTRCSMFQGETAITIDDKGRLAVPTAYRDLVARECDNRLVITYNPFESGSLYLYPLSIWERVRDQVNKLPKVKQVNRNMQLKLVGAAAFVELDVNG